MIKTWNHNILPRFHIHLTLQLISETIYIILIHCCIKTHQAEERKKQRKNIIFISRLLWWLKGHFCSRLPLCPYQYGCCGTKTGFPKEKRCEFKSHRGYTIYFWLAFLTDSHRMSKVAIENNWNQDGRNTKQAFVIYKVWQ